MKFKIQACLALGMLFSAAGMQAEILAWRSDAAVTLESRMTIRETVTGLDSATSRDPQTTIAAVNAAEAAGNKSIVAWLRGIPSFPETDLTPGSKWTETGTVTLNLSRFGLAVPVEVRVPVTYTLLGTEEPAGGTLFHVRAEWYPFFIPSSGISKRTGISRISGASRMDLYWDNGSGRVKNMTMTEETQYRFVENTSLLFTRETAGELKGAAK